MLERSCAQSGEKACDKDRSCDHISIVEVLAEMIRSKTVNL